MNKILLIEPDEDNCSLMTELLEIEGFKVISTGCSELALRLVAEKKPDLVICSLLLTESNGLEVLKCIKESREFANIPVAFLTTNSSCEARNMALKLGADEYLTKPIEFTVLLKAVKSQLKKLSIAS